MNLSKALLIDCLKTLQTPQVSRDTYNVAKSLCERLTAEIDVGFFVAQDYQNHNAVNVNKLIMIIEWFLNELRVFEGSFEQCLWYIRTTESKLFEVIEKIFLN